MYECPNCSANLKFDIRSQMLLCDRCGTQMDPYAFQKEKDADETSVLEEDCEVTVYTCPQCGGQLMSDDTTAATFCSFCGGSTILHSRVSNMRRPTYIIPFQKTKEDCGEAYRKMMKRALYAPTEMKKEGYISRMRSIYMPYWVYTAEKYGRVRLSASQYVKNIKYDVTMYFWLQSNVQAEYKGIAFDASQSFADPLSNAIAPYEWWGLKRFTPSYLSGFYADVADVDPELYESDVSEIVGYELYRRMEKEPAYEKYTLGEVADEMRPNYIYKELAMFPVWFLTYRHKDRVSYAVVNGQTGKAAGDIPVDKGRYFMGSFLLALPIFILLNLAVSMQASTMLFLAGLMAGICGFISVEQKKLMRAREDYMDDKGSGRYLNIGAKRYKALSRGTKVNVKEIVGIGGLTVLYVLMAFFTGGGQSAVKLQLWSLIIYVVVLIVSPRTIRVGGGRSSQPDIPLSVKDILTAVWKPGMGVLAVVLVLVWHPTAVVFYYVAAVAVTLLMVWDVIGILNRHNLLTSRPLPQFDRRGGEEDGR
ncbi:MAG: zinc ribbon domain-containing protein [Lachnospiraceae bacterium]|nr:zinc ribbon domain-containing protein [Lachnospiraceae bacterium]